MRFSSSRILKISRAWMSMSVAWPCTPPNGWWIMMRACGSANRLPRAPAQSRSSPIDADGLECLEGSVEGLGEFVVEIRQDLLFDLDEPHIRGARLVAQALHPMVGREAQRHVPLLAGAHADDRLIDLGEHRAAAHDELIARRGRRVVPFGRKRVVDDDEVAGRRRSLHRAELRVLLAQV